MTEESLAGEASPPEGQEGAFDDLHLEDDDNSILCSPPGAPTRPGLAMVTPGQPAAGPDYLTSTPYVAQAEGHQARQEAAQLRKALDDQRHENWILTDEIHRQYSKAASLKTVRAGLEGELEGHRVVVEQLQRQLTELQTSDTVQHDQLLARQLLARQQHDAIMRSLMERQAKETAALRAAADTARGRAEQLEVENGRLGTGNAA